MPSQERTQQQEVQQHPPLEQGNFGLAYTEQPQPHSTGTFSCAADVRLKCCTSHDYTTKTPLIGTEGAIT